jgi:hypothetical protein
MNVLRRHAHWIAAMTLAIVSGCGAADETTTTSGAGASSSGEGGKTSSNGSSGIGGKGGKGGEGGEGGEGGKGSGGASGGSGGLGGAAGFGGMGGKGGAGGMTSCASNVDCDDSFSCTIDVCTAGVCSHTPNDKACNDDTYCNGAESCNPTMGAAGTGCTVGSGSPCDDGISCTADACNEAMDTCDHTPKDTLCSNGVGCDGEETCNPTLGCVSGTPTDCDDKINCTADYCDLNTGACAHVENDSFCANDSFCDGVEKCDKLADCKPGTPIDCNDGIACTADSCNEATDSCAYVTNDAVCADVLYCNGVEICVVGVGCQPGSPVDCNDNRSCTSDTCNEARDACVHTGNDAICDDGIACNGLETCSPDGAPVTGCLAQPPVQCSDADGFACTAESCHEPSGSCTATPNSALCNVAENCSPTLGCVAAAACSMDSECDDGNACNGAETCNGTYCVYGMPMNCDDGVSCTNDSCDDQTGACLNTPNDSICNDGFACNGVETCDNLLGCINPPDVNCDDNIACTLDQCNEPLGTCVRVPHDFLCDDSQFCNGVEVCGATGCEPGAPPTCNDGITCTFDYCDPMTDSCQPVPNDSLCACGETCNPQAGGCGNFCTVTTCHGKVYACGDCIDNDGDCKIDSQDSQCLGPCDNTEDSFNGGITAPNKSPCAVDCYFDQDLDSGNDQCYWSHKCDPLEVPPNYPPDGMACSYNPGASIPGSSISCAQASTTQSQDCIDSCRPITPNGCDCFGCCALPGVNYTVWLGSEDPVGVGSCNANTINDPTKCKPCTQVQACINTCDTCELCIGQTQLPPGCAEQSCPAGVQKCGQEGQTPCPSGSSCITGCCSPNP